MEKLLIDLVPSGGFIVRVFQPDLGWFRCEFAAGNKMSEIVAAVEGNPHVTENEDGSISLGQGWINGY